MKTFIMKNKQGEVNQYNRIIEEIEIPKAKVTIRSRVKWEKVGDKCSAYSLSQ